MAEQPPRDSMRRAAVRPVAADSWPRARTGRLVLVLGLLTCLVGPGCARNRGGRRLDLGALTPPSMLGAHVRSQDGSKLAGRIRRRRGETAPTRVASDPGPQVAWSDPLPAPPGPRPRRNQSPPTYLTAPPPPSLPADAGQVATIPAPAAKPPASKPATAQAPAEIQAPPGLIASASGEPEEKAEDSGADDVQQIRTLLSQSKAHLQGITNYRAVMTRQERVGSELLPVEEVLLSVRRNPKAVRLEWPSGKNKGREVIFSDRETSGQLQIYMPGSLVPRMTLAPDSPLVMRSSRHPITEAGFDALIENLDRSLRPHETGSPTSARISYSGVETPEGLTQSCHKIVEVRENGETWVVYLEAETKLPLLIHATDRNGALLERYAFRDVQADLPELSAATAFNPDARWGASGGLFSRMARSANSGGETANPGPR